MSELFGFTRNVVKERYALLTPSGFVPSCLPGAQKAVCNVLISRAMGAAFSQLLITVEDGGHYQTNTETRQFFVYLLGGNATVILEKKKHRLDAGGYVYVPAGTHLQLEGASAGTRLLIFQKEFQ